MFNAHPALFKIMDNPVLPGKIPDNLGKAGGLDILGRLEMVRHQYDFFPVKYRAAYLLKAAMDGGAVISLAITRSRLQ